MAQAIRTLLMTDPMLVLPVKPKPFSLCQQATASRAARNKRQPRRKKQ